MTPIKVVKKLQSNVKLKDSIFYRPGLTHIEHFWAKQKRCAEKAAYGDIILGSFKDIPKTF